jgi:hypothetical protein
MRATVYNYDPQALDDRLTGLDSAGVDELNIKGRSLNRPFLERVVQVRECDGTLYTGEPEHTLADSRSMFRKHYHSDDIENNIRFT